MWWAIIMVWLHPLEWRLTIQEYNCRETKLLVWDISTTWWEEKRKIKLVTSQVTSRTLSWWLHVHLFMLFYNTVYFFTLGASMWFYFRFSWKNPKVHSTCRYGTVETWVIQNTLRHLPSRNNTINGWLCRKLHPTTTKWNTKSILSLRTSEHNGPYHVSTWAR